MKIKVMILCVNKVEKIREVIKNDIVHVVHLFSPFLFLSFPPLSSLFFSFPPAGQSLLPLFCCYPPPNGLEKQVLTIPNKVLTKS